MRGKQKKEKVMKRIEVIVAMIVSVVIYLQGMLLLPHILLMRTL